MFNFWSSSSKAAEPAPADPAAPTARSPTDTARSVDDSIDSANDISSRQPSASQSAHAVGSHLAGPHGTDHISSTQNEPDFGPGPGSGSPTSSDPAQVTSSTDASIGHVHDTSASHTAVSTNLGHPGASLSRPLDSMAGIGSTLPPTSSPTGHLDSRQHAHDSNTCSGTQMAPRHDASAVEGRSDGQMPKINPLYDAATAKAKEGQDHNLLSRASAETSIHHKHEDVTESDTKAALDPTTGEGAHVGRSHPSDRIKMTETERAALKADKARHAPVSAASDKHAGPSGHKPTFVEMAKGTIEVVIGKVTHNDAKIAEGTALKTGQASQPTPQTY